MKKTLLVTLLLVTLVSGAFAGEKKSNTNYLNALTKALDTCSSTKFSSAVENQKRQSFNYRGKLITACFYDEMELAGFSVSLAKGDLPLIIAQAVNMNYSEWVITEAILFIDASAEINYFLHISKDNDNLALKVTLDGHASIFSKM